MVSSRLCRAALGTYAHGKGAAKVIEDDPGTGVARVIHLEFWGRIINGSRECARERGRQMGARPGDLRWR